MTPSVQDRLDRQFAAASTPHPSRDTLFPSLGGESRRRRRRRAPLPRRARPQIDTQPLKRPPKRSRLLAGAAVAASLLAAAASCISWFFRARRRRRPFPLPRRRGAGKTRRRRLCLPRLPPRNRPRPRRSPAVLPPPTAPAREPTRCRSAGGVSTRRQRRDAEQARSRAAAARRLAERANAPERVAALYDFGASKEREGRDLFSRGEFAAAAAAFDAGRDSFARAEEWTRAHPVERPTVSERIATLSAPDHSPPVSGSGGSTAVGPRRRRPGRQRPLRSRRKRRVASASRKRTGFARPSGATRRRNPPSMPISTLASIPPSTRPACAPPSDSFARRRSSSRSRRSNCRRAGKTAVVRGVEKRAAQPQVGSEQHAVNNRVITLEKRGDAWVITKLGD